MKRIVISLIVFGLATGVCFAYLMQWRPKVKPPLSLPEAYGIAMQSLGSLTNDFHCLSALTQVSGQGPNWNFSFSNTNGASKTVFVYFDKKAKPEVLDSQDVWY
jgi:hypothetical protein